MNFRGQDMDNKKQFLNPNDPGAQVDEYIENLQQQLHFMDLEFKILREKVQEDEKKSGIGSLYDDDKTQHQHIFLLKQKYAAMLKNFHKVMTELQKQQLEVQGETFVLHVQLNTAKQLNEKLKKDFEEFKSTSGA
jgi:2'-5' RNA ligase